MTARTALQINMHPLDARHVAYTLEHQLGVWSGQVDRISLTVDSKRSRSGRYRGSDYEENRDRLYGCIQNLANRYPKIDIVEVDYSSAAREAVREKYFSTVAAVPEKAFDGGPFHAYFFGLLAANADYVVHMDSDMLFGGASQTWLQEAIRLLENTPDALFVGPLPGPPREDGELADLHRAFPGRTGLPVPTRLATPYPAYRFQSVSTRIFVLDQRRFHARVQSLDLVRPDAKRRLRALLYRESPLSAPAEEVLTDAMIRKGFYRIDFLGTGAGMYSLHPPYRSEHFYRELPRLIARIVDGDIPAAQRGDYDVNSSMIDWTEALLQKTKSRRLLRATRQLLRV